MSIKPSKGLLDAEYLIFKPCYAKDWVNNYKKDSR
jgi:hypothetical protein